MIALLLLAAAIYGVRYVVRQRNVPGPIAGEPTWAVDRLSGPGWSLVALDSDGPLRAVDLDDPSVDPETDIALGMRDHDVN